MSSGDVLEAALADFAERGRAAWPDVPLDEAALAAYLGARAPEDVDAVTWLEGLRAGDLFIACAAAGGHPRALAAFDAALLGKVDIYLRALRPTPEIVAEARQRLREKLFMGTLQEPPRILRYDGRGSLEGWVRVAAVRTALNLLEAEQATRPRPDEADELARAMLPGADPELELVRESYRAEFTAAFREAIAALSRRDRGLLRSVFVERFTPARIAAAYGVHRTTTMRWIEAAQAEVLKLTRARMMERLRLSPSDCDQVLGLVRSALDLSLSSLMRTPS